ncbi:MAG TPA: undecaprenyldiphospho-muramoylpentapeptide beta-N-acetylglucosaminyltransferase [Vitreimonas sp.]|uniref:undecaprenyldiphospho-muramoylpentapeptide beta-N-acetylglucosaminyltransferase n=1 Tax=Vitreimonas sp. TaxID=3069702 RepID=UPI002D319B79|nr:undecaprenyldiphospho-muramoylpentapeptide beta-N-acetylglucosaminyltransferase [Vitreimonas sp.]HYD86571.1 undecaprenyldiphospho-muramoylpentapeptide beta-N-acetylglucosaminyltransferase [Vitreimonas sp.]
MAKKIVVIAAGGTGGHLFPAAAFAEEMFRRGWRVVLMTDARGRRYAEGFPAERIMDVPAASLSMNPFTALPAMIKISRGIDASKKVFDELKPSLVAGFGGYPSFPALMAARAKHVPIIIHEQNSVLGRVNRTMAASAAIVACGFERLDRLPAKAADRKRVVGNPVRLPILAVRERPYPEAPAGGRMNLLIIGGSQGARLFGEVIPAAIALLPQVLRARLDVVHQVREEQVAQAKKVYQKANVNAEVSPFFSDMGQRLGAAHLVISRAGASSVTELQVAGRPAILVPFAAAADDHQTANAEGLTAVGAADLFTEDDFEAAPLAATLERRLADPHGLAVRAAAARAAAKPEAASTLADLAESIAA